MGEVGALYQIALPPFHLEQSFALRFGFARADINIHQKNIGGISAYSQVGRTKGTEAEIWIYQQSPR